MNPDRWPRIKELFHAALERAPNERADFLQNECDGDETIRAEVDRLLAAHSEAGSFIEGSPVMSVAEHKAPPLPMTGRVMGHYQVSRLIGTGGMGSVYAAHDVELGRVVALKVVAGDEEAQTRLRREAQQASQLNHPHICTIHEVGTSEGQAFFAMEYVDGRTLSELLARKALPLEAVLRYGIQIADALAHAHRHGLIHRDLKSANVMVTPDGSAKVLDFGLACGVAADRINELTQSKSIAPSSEGGLIAGTLPYMAPELLRGESADVRSDIWALGVMLYEMVTGRRPFDGATGFELSAAILHQPPAPFPNSVPTSLQGIILRCLTKDLHDRYAQAGEVRAALEAVRLEVASGAIARPLLSAAKQPISRRMQAVLASGAVVLALALGLLWFWMRPASTPVGVGASGRPAVAVMAFDNMAGAQDTAWLSKGVPTMLLTGLAQTRGLDLVSAQRLHEALKQLGHENLESLDQGQAAAVARRAGAGAVVVGSIAKSGSELRIDAQLEDLSTGRVLVAETVRGTDVFGLVDQLAARIREGVGFSDVAGVRPVVDVSSGSLEAYRLYSQALDASDTVRWDDAQKFLEAAVAIDPDFAEAYLQLAFVNRLLGRETSWRDNLLKAAEHSDRLNDRQRLLLEVESARQRGDSASATRLLDELIARFPDSDDAYYIAFQLYGPFGAVHDPEKALKILAEGVATRPSSGVYHNNYGYGLLEAGRYTDAIRQLEAYARLAPREPNPYDSLGEAYLNIGAPEKAIEYYSRALNADPRFTNGHNGRAWALGMLGNYDKAIAEDPPDIATKAFILSRAGRYTDAAHVLTAGLLDVNVNKSASTQGGLALLLSLFAQERREYALARQELRKAEQAFAQMTAQDRRPFLVLVDTMAGSLEIALKRPDTAASRLDALKHRYKPALVMENWWAKALEGDIALADGRLQDATDAYAAGEPSRRMWFYSLMPAISILANNLPSRDGLARVARARGDLAGAIQEYRRLTSGKSRWNAMLEPRYILETARLLEQTGDKKSASVEYSRFLDLWKQADAGLPELAEARRAVARIDGRTSATK